MHMHVRFHGSEMQGLLEILIYSAETLTKILRKLAITELLKSSRVQRTVKYSIREQSSQIAPQYTDAKIYSYHCM